jgi:hypothetical protein
MWAVFIGARIFGWVPFYWRTVCDRRLEVGRQGTCELLRCHSCCYGARCPFHRRSDARGYGDHGCCVGCGDRVAHHEPGESRVLIPCAARGHGGPDTVFTVFISGNNRFRTTPAVVEAPRNWRWLQQLRIGWWNGRFEASRHQMFPKRTTAICDRQERGRGFWQRSPRFRYRSLHVYGLILQIPSRGENKRPRSLFGIAALLILD